MRSFGTVAAAIREPGMIGPFGLSTLAALAVLVVAWIVVPFLIPAGVPAVVTLLISVVVGAVGATEAYLRAMPPRSRRAFEAFSWLGEWELDQARRLTGGRVPTTRWGARRWLTRHPDRPEAAWLRVEILLLAGELDAARALSDQLPEATPEERFQRAAARELVDWISGGDGMVDEMVAAADRLEPVDGDERLRAEVAIAAARVRRLAAGHGAVAAESAGTAAGGAVPGDPLEPLLEVRDRLGSRADGQVGRALRPRLLPILIVYGVLFGILFNVVLPRVGAAG